MKNSKRMRQAHIKEVEDSVSKLFYGEGRLSETPDEIVAYELGHKRGHDFIHITMIKASELYGWEPETKRKQTEVK